MVDAHYPLQALLYSVALHRYLRWRRPGYDPAEHLGGVLYLYLRGMSGPGVVGADGRAPGVFSWRPPAGLVVGFSDLLAGGVMSAHSPELALRATGLLAELNAAGVLSAADVHVARRLGALVEETDERVLLAAALTVRSTRAGSVVVDLATVADHGRPRRRRGRRRTSRCRAGRAALAVGGRVGRRVRRQPHDVRPRGPAAAARGRGSGWPATTRRSSRSSTSCAAGRRRLPDDLDLDRLPAGLDRLFPRAADADQRLAAAVCALSRVSVLAGGPGTGKTTTVSRVLALLTEQHPTWRVALAAPTGKAAARLEEAVRSSAAGFASEDDRRHVEQLAGVTLHRLLGWRPGSRSRFRHDAGNRLPVEVVVVDEASMVPLTMMARLLEALREGTRLVLVGDPDQLASVEAGAVLGDLVDRTSLGARTAAMTRRAGPGRPRRTASVAAAADRGRPGPRRHRRAHRQPPLRRRVRHRRAGRGRPRRRRRPRGRPSCAPAGRA